MKQLIAILLSISIALSGCASTPANPVPIAQVGDDTKTCDAITNEMQQMIAAQDKAAADRNTQIGTNAALGVVGVFLIVPWFFMDLGATASVEQKAAAARFQRLQQMAADKKCTGVPVMKPDTTSANSDNQSLQVDPNAPVTTSTASGVTTKTQNLTAQSSAAFPSKDPKKDDLPNPVKRLDDLNNLLKKGLITQKEYDTKKAEILKGL
ncbi:MAG: SHOCT domain-containing protein [Chlamydiia bacterium]